ncbi:MAG: hypothetical protein KA072_00630 [Thermoanaerobaculaceae bacterium]|nr:hypothetical protein [Thermoanaerobaculaceae bacterium]MDI9621242.1 hypothetical protein [Acidobacteriota bacterium]
MLTVAPSGGVRAPMPFDDLGEMVEAIQPLIPAFAVPGLLPPPMISTFSPSGRCAMSA